ncbi:MAG TPA: prolyl oligopeptidase family serine peptidase, partial [Sphingomicrobium sp.]|nr:prolyl oligopeptidase family serine peptidase [Sphingomicrobium sp.]
RSLDLATGADRPLGPPRPVPPFQPPNITAAAEATSASGDLAQASWDGATGSLSARMSDGSRRTCADPLCATGHISALVWRPGSQDVLVTFMDREHRQSLYLWRPASDMLRRLTAADGLLSGGRRNMVPCAVAPGSAICVAAAPASPPRLERIDLATGARSVLFDPNAELRTSYRPDVRYLRWKSRDGATAAGVLMTRGGMSPHDAPLYLNYYACEGFLRGGEGDEWPIPALLDAGFAVACVNSVPFTGPQIAVQTYRGGLDAVGALVDRLSGEGIVDPRKIAMGGLSFGSEVTMWTAIHSRLLAAVSISSAQFEPSEYWTSAMPGSDQPSLIRKVWGLGSPEDTPREWRLLAPALNAGSIAAPVLFQLPEQEARRIPELYARLARSGTPTELYAFPDEPHIKIQPRHRLAVYERNLDWFRYWLQDYRDPDPAKAAQYERWDRLRARWPRSSAASATTAARAPSRRAP